MQCFRDGKSIIVEGLHLDPGLYLEEFGQLGQLLPVASRGNPVAMPSASKAGHMSPDGALSLRYDLPLRLPGSSCSCPRVMLLACPCLKLIHTSCAMLADNRHVVTEAACAPHCRMSASDASPLQDSVSAHDQQAGHAGVSQRRASFVFTAQRGKMVPTLQPASISCAGPLKARPCQTGSSPSRLSCNGLAAEIDGGQPFDNQHRDRCQEEVMGIQAGGASPCSIQSSGQRADRVLPSTTQRVFSTPITIGRLPTKWQSNDYGPKVISGQRSRDLIADEGQNSASFRSATEDSIVKMYLQPASPASSKSQSRGRDSLGPGPGPVFVPIILTMAKDDHQLLVGEWQERLKVGYHNLVLCMKREILLAMPSHCPEGKMQAVMCRILHAKAPGGAQGFCTALYGIA